MVGGLDILPEAKLDAEWGRPGDYDGYIMADITEYVHSAQAQHQGIAPPKSTC